MSDRWDPQPGPSRENSGWKRNYRRGNNHWRNREGLNNNCKPRWTGKSQKRPWSDNVQEMLEKGKRSKRMKLIEPEKSGIIDLFNIVPHILDDNELLIKVFKNKDDLKKLLKQPIENPDIIVQIVSLISQLKFSAFQHISLKIVSELEIHNSIFIDTLNNYFMDLPDVKDQDVNKKYWQNQCTFWNNFVEFCIIVLRVTPSNALLKYRTLIEVTTKSCIDRLKEKHETFCLPATTTEKINYIVLKLKEKINKQKTPKVIQNVDGNAPLENFRELSVYPSRSDLMDRRPFLRPNIVNGSYSDVEHYLDVQFRLLREDCFGPLREGILQYMEAPNVNQYDNIRVFKNAKFTVPYASNMKVGMVVQLDVSCNKWLKRVNWSHSKRLIFGSLLLFTKDFCKTFIVTTVADRDPKMLEKGMIPVSIIHKDINEKLNENDSYLMIESEVYFEPYLHVLKALQDPNFPQQLAMKQYIVAVNPTPKHPAYLLNTTAYSVNVTEINEKQSFNVMNTDEWPPNESLGLNKSQYEAYQLALTKEFAVIQGPPGTGKTYLGTKIARTLYENVNCKILIICYTNHALDQFLEAITSFTDSIVRIGGQSRNEAMEQYNLNRLKATDFNTPNTYRIFKEQKDNLKWAVLALKQWNSHVESLNNSIVSYDTVLKYAPECEALAYNRRKGLCDPLISWLFEDMEICDFVQNNDNYNPELNRIDEDIFRRDRYEMDKIFNDRDYEEYVEINNDIKIVFCLSAAKEEIKRIISQYNNVNEWQRCSLQREVQLLNSKIQHFIRMSRYRNNKTSCELGNSGNPNYMPMEERWTMYYQWVNIIIKDIKEKMKPYQDALEFTSMAHEEAQMIYHSELIKEKRVIGMTTSGAARLRKLLQVVAAPLVIVEEAAEVLEAHIVTALTKHCKHLILIGDHQQLRPSAAHMRLAKHFNIEVSLFERMIMNKIHSRRLTVQHRMRPEIAALISPLIYEDLTNHPSVETFPNVRGMMRNLFFVTHNHKEEQERDNASKSNEAEGDMVLHLAKYLMQQGYQPQDITILAAYNGQMFYMRKQRSRYPPLANVKITVVDNYQGEESKIILLSLVRNNDIDKIGFLGTKNRICVALSRAKEGLYIFGNIDILKRNSELWQDIATNLENTGCLGSNLRLQCVNHPEQITTIVTLDDYKKVPHGGCLLKCNFKWECNHPCPLDCHTNDREHKLQKCRQPCERKPIGCELNHACPLLCYVECKPCMQKVVKRLQCGHDQTEPCHLKPGTDAINCQTVVTVTLSDCGHETKKECHENENKVTCPALCDVRVDTCGHACIRKCHVRNDPEHIKYKCQKPCARAKNGCTANIEGDRGDHQCNKKCFEACDNCNVLVKKLVPDCQHEVEIACSKVASGEICSKECKRTLACGHKCKALCKEECGSKPCKALVDEDYVAPCGHSVKLPCYLYKSIKSGGEAAIAALDYCNTPCGEELACGHLCSGSCNRCRRGALHVACTKPCLGPSICGHSCEEPCNQMCSKPCEVKCQHSRCRNKCGVPCTPCKEPCTRRCDHGKCRRRCSEPCVSSGAAGTEGGAACSKPCSRKLVCGHACAGLCGEPCLPRCRVCNPEHPCWFDFLGDLYPNNARFVLLVDCKHIMELDDIENWIKADSDTVKMPTCPKCRKPIVNTQRYKDHVNLIMRTQINPIKQKVFGNIRNIEIEKLKLKQKLRTSSDARNIMKDCINWNSAFDNLKNIILKNYKRHNVSLIELEMCLVQLDILDAIRESHNLFRKDGTLYFKDELNLYTNIICKVLKNNTNKLSQQQQIDINNELKRINSIVQLSKINKYTNHTENMKDFIEEAKKIVLTYRRFDEEQAIEKLEKAAKLVNNTVITKMERQMIVSALGMKAGHWYKCPNGHFYCITECGGAMEVGKCNECGASIGGTRHRLLADNAHAGEMDNSKFPAWSEQNNLENFRLD